MIKNKPLSVVIFTEGGRHIGFGHITRCLALAQAFKDTGINPQFIIKGDDTVRGMLKNEKYTLRDWITKSVDEYLRGADIVVVDSYLAKGKRYRTVSQEAKVCLSIDDNNRISYPAGIVVNGSIGAQNIISARKKGMRYLLGTRYTPLRKIFRDNPDKHIRKTLKNIVVTFGGDDFRGLTPRVLGLLCQYYPRMTKTVLIGKSFIDIPAIVKKRDPKTRLVYYPDAKRMKKELFLGDVAITAGGQTLYECACVGIPAVAVCVAGNQKNNIAGFKKKGFIYDAGSWDDAQRDKNLLRAFSVLKTKPDRQKKYAIGRSLVDGKGAQRIVKVGLEEYFERMLVLRKPDAEDIKRVFLLSNDSAVRKSSFEQHRISWRDHLRWFDTIRKEKKYIFLLAEAADNFIGQVRFQMDKKQASVSISITREFRGKHAGSVVLQRAIRYLAQHAPEITALKAYIRRDNPVSVVFFEQAGFSDLKKTLMKGQKAFELSRVLKQAHKR